MIDIHSHLIPNVDDGAKTPQETIELIKEAEKVGITDIILTPHYIINAYEQNANTLILLKDKLQQIIDKDNINVKLHIGMEVYIINNLIDLLKQLLTKIMLSVGLVIIIIIVLLEKLKRLSFLKN